MSETLRVRVYNIRFGDAVLVTVPDNGTTRHILIDVGNVLVGEGGLDAVFRPVLEDVKAELDGKPLDLYVMTHEHMDHIQGLPFAKEKEDLELDVAFAWLTASAAEDYYDEDKHPDARKKNLEAVAMFDRIEAYLDAAPDPALKGLLLNNNPRSTGDCVKYLRGIAAPDKTAYVHRETDIEGTHPFEEAKLEIWAPEENTADYYRSLQPLALGVDGSGGNGATPSLINPLPPAGVDAGAFYDLVDSRRSGLHDNLLAIDKAANNTSIVFSLEWRGWRLLFPGDAEQESWKKMAEQGVLEPVHLLKIAHHGSWNGTPQGEILDQILPITPPDDRKRYAVVSTCLETYPGVPDDTTENTLKARVDEFHTTLGLADADHFDIELPG
jgi:glyoxylase-like metal-dependent hydrolase (beta-lactamase superfamily II)